MKKKILAITAAFVMTLCTGCKASSSNDKTNNTNYNNNNKTNNYNDDNTASKSAAPSNPIPGTYDEYWNKLYTRSLDWDALKKHVLNGGANKVTYQQLARDTNGMFNKNIIVKGEVAQVMDLDDESWYEGLISITYHNDDYFDYYDDNIYFIIPKNYVSQRILDGDILTLTGKSAGLYTYENAFGASLTVPCITAVKAEFN